MIVITAARSGWSSSVWARLGTKVTVVEFLPRIAAIFDEDITQALELLQNKGSSSTLAPAWVCRENQNWHQAEGCQGDKSLELEAEKVLVAVGRKPNTDGLGATEAGVELDERGRIRTDAEWQTNVPGIYAIGDVIGPMLAGGQEAVAAVERMAGKAGRVNTTPFRG